MYDLMIDVFTSRHGYVVKRVVGDYLAASSILHKRVLLRA